MLQRDRVNEKLKPFFVDKGQNPENYVLNLITHKWEYLKLYLEKKETPPFEVEVQIDSRCNLKCRWCIGEALQRDEENIWLKEEIDESEMVHIAKSITDFQINGLGIQAVKFSGFIGEPLRKKKAVLAGMKILFESDIDVGLFTNGVFMTSDTWELLSHCLYVNISLDAGPRTYHYLKEATKTPYSDSGFTTVLDNIKGLVETRNKIQSRTNITVSFVVIPGNYQEMDETARILKKIGVDRIRFKCDIAGFHDLGKNQDILNETTSILKKIKSDLNDENFKVLVVHDRSNIVSKYYQRWDRTAGCHFHHLMGTVGSDGSLYMCDHNTMPSAKSLGSLLKQSFGGAWLGTKREYAKQTSGKCCQSSVCPPFGNAVNLFIQAARECIDLFGIEPTFKVLEEFRSSYSLT